MGKSIWQENPAQDADVFTIDTKLETLSNAWKEFVKSGDELAKYDKLEGYVDPTEDFGIYEEKYEIANARLKALRAALAPSGKLEEIGAAGSQPVATPATRDCELPKINIKPFGGDYKEWHAFKDLFESTIHGKTTLTNIQKFHHLKSCVIGEAAILIQHLPVVDANYVTAWKSLSDRYEKPRYLAILHSEIAQSNTKATQARLLRSHQRHQR
ncbi:uncharacterized protein LOC124461858 [Drosophila willistoni]|uniref:uncharacterized protein LOC124461858 n=1 Tax=Drosophila willistoni TaxID=7260 RepID=UPI001F0785DD|nr:uncharacterized protein LOC124461858 [Drosophila willistoni]